MSEEILQKILELGTKSEKVEITILHNASIEASNNYKEDPTTSKLRDWQNAKSSFEIEKRKLNLKYELIEKIPKENKIFNNK